MNERQILARMQEILNLARSENRDLTDAETREYDDLQRQLNALRAQSQQQTTGQDEGQRGAADDTSGAEPQNEAARAVEAERTRVTEITTLCRQFSLDADEYIRGGQSIDEVRRLVLLQLQQSRTPASIRTGDTGEDNFRRDMETALLLKAGIAVENAPEGARRMQGMTLRGIAEECLVRDGATDSEVRRMDATEILERVSSGRRYGERQFYNPTAAFPAILDSSIRKSIVELYNQVPTSFQRWTTKGSVSDFKETKDHEYLLGGAGEFLEVPENGELKHDTPSTVMLPTRQIKTYGRQFTMTREAFINDDISFMTRVPGLYAQSAKKTIDRQVYSILYNNSTIFDGTALFTAGHGNLVSGADASKPTQAAIQAMILLMQKQKDPFGDPIYMTPQYLIVPVGYGFDLDVILHSAQVVGSGHNDKNPLYNYPIEIIETPVLNAMAGSGAVPWFIVSNVMSAKSIQVDYLNGNEIPTVRRMETPGKLGFVWDIYLDWGVSVRDFRGIVKNAGEAIG